MGKINTRKMHNWIDRCVECTSASIQCLALFKKLYPTHRTEEVYNGINKGANFIESMQRNDGSWYGNWGVCFTHATWFGVRGLVCAGRTFKNSPAIKKACEFLLSKELPSGGWGESYLSCQDKVTLLQSTCLYILTNLYFSLAVPIGDIHVILYFCLLQCVYHL